MGRLKALPNLNPLLSGKYKRLLEDSGSKDYSKLIPDEESFSYNCTQCGHTQPLQIEDLNSIIGHAFRLAYTAHIQKSGDPLPSKDVISSSSLTPLAPSLKSSKLTIKSSQRSLTSCQVSHSNKKKKECCCSHNESKCHSPSSSSDDSLEKNCCQSCNSVHSSCHLKSSNTSSHIDKRSSKLSYRYSKVRRERKNQKVISKSNRSPKSWCSSQSSCCSSSNESTMRTPTHMRHQSKEPPSCLPGLNCVDNQNNMSLSPDSDNSNSPTEMNSSRRVGEKPPLIKNMNLCLESNLLLEQELNNVISKNISLNSHSMNVPIRQSTNSPLLSRLKEGLNIKNNKFNTTNSNLTVELSTLNRDTSNDPPPLPERTDSLMPLDEPHLKTAAWFQAGIPREIALEVLSREPIGAFMVRESTSKPGCYALSLRVPKDFAHSGIAHYLIVKTTKGYKIKGFTKDFCSLTALITHHSVMPELLPCPLSLNRYYPPFSPEDNNANEDPDYSTLSEFRKMMSDLNV